MSSTPTAASTPSLEELSAKATPDVWDTINEVSDDGDTAVCIMSGSYYVATLHTGIAGEQPCDENNAAFIVALVNAYRAGALSPAAGRGAVVEECALPEDLFTHKHAFRTALVLAESAAIVSPPDIDDRSYWRHEIEVFDRVWEELHALSLAPASPIGGQAAVIAAATRKAERELQTLQRTLDERPIPPTGGQASSPVVTEDARDAARYRRLRVLGCALNDSRQLENGTVLRFSGLDEAVDTDIRQIVSRGEAAALPARAAEQAVDAIRREAYEQCALIADGHEAAWLMGKRTNEAQIVADTSRYLAQAFRSLIPPQAAEQAGVWQHIASAPKDGTVVDLWGHWPEHDRWCRSPDARWNADTEDWQIGQNRSGQYVYPPQFTHWSRPLPAPPRTAEQPSGGPN